MVIMFVLHQYNTTRLQFNLNIRTNSEGVSQKDIYIASQTKLRRVLVERQCSMT